ncbi:nicotinate-nucleotide adenylyltransferase [Rivibacter subsaxonicus]|uniref:Probable nicotinate-nucleotide adenylyltransferase n=1 Tax=Rivibacter subsaxonicus TaxID=457575 RepID=A0A4Q7W279_9BURK|nr:nicotinate-nucleotide adenylyltransferase [Rivibacter subsaxonicus]RZU03025.1 nicotinate-nucleotide adenylyltransferase [Rivibacter subsaxonicus]
MTSLPAKPVRRIGVYGGSFDPPHMGHLVLAQSAREALSLDRVLWVPVGHPWQKTDAAGHRVTEAAHREAMVRAAIAHQSGFALDRREIERDGPSYTIDTVRELQAEHPQATIFLIIGQDQYERLNTWREWRELLTRVTLAVADRDGRSAATPRSLMMVWHRVEPVPMPPMAVSSTEIRERIGAGASAASLVPEMVPAVVARYIDQHHLYRAASGTTAAA